MKRFESIIEDIKSVKIQGADNVAKAGITAYSLKPESWKKVLAARPTEPLLQNSISMLVKSKNRKAASQKILKYIKKSEKKISSLGSKMIKSKMIFTHCHSSNVVNILKNARKKGKNFVVYNTETYPLLQGRRTAEELSRAGIKVIHVPDNAAEQILKNCDLFLFGADAYLKKGVVNKIGTSMLCQIAKLYNVPRFSCGISLKYSKKIKIESRSGKEVWDERSKMIEVLNPAFDTTSKKLISGVVSELGILTYREFIKKARLNLKKFQR
jgi:translation initiation factor 2B subunit (eIF-2B alpha/beta/delta family)